MNDRLCPPKAKVGPFILSLPPLQNNTKTPIKEIIGILLRIIGPENLPATVLRCPDLLDGRKKMPETQTAEAAVGLIAQIAESLGYPAIIIELIIVGFLIILLLVVVFAVLAIFRIRKELISLNFKIVYIGRLIEQAVKKPSIPVAAKKSPKVKAKKPTPPEPTEATEKFKL